MSEYPVKLGLMPPLTGLVGIYGTEISQAGQIACQEVNENGGVLGRPLELAVEDDGSLPESAVAAATRLVDQLRCAAIIGNLLSNSRIAVAYRVAEPRRIPYLNFSFYEGSISSRYFFHFAALPNQQIDRMIPYMREKYGPRVFFAGNNYEWPRGSIHAAKLALVRAGGEVVGEEYCPIGVDLANMERLLDRIDAAAPDVFVPYFAGADQMNLLTRFARRGLKVRMAVVMGHYDEMMASKLPPEVRDGFYSCNTYFMTVDSAENRKTLARLSAQPGVTGIWPHGNGILTNFGEGTYICVKAFAQAANEAGSLHPEALVDVLKAIRVSGPQGVVHMDPVTHHAAVNTYLSRCQADGVFAIIEKFGAIEPVLPERYNHQRISNQATLEEDIRLQARMLEQMSEAILLSKTKDGTIVYANAGAEKMFGHCKGELIGKDVSLLYTPSDKIPGVSAIPDITRILPAKGAWQGEIQCKKKDGVLIWCFVTISTFTHPMHGEVWMGVHLDITERKQAEEGIKKLNAELESRVADRTAQLEASNKELEAFAYSVSHDLRAPLRSIDGFSQALIEDYGETLDELGKSNLRRVRAATQRMAQLIDDLLALSKVTRTEMIPQRVNLSKLAEDIAEELRRQDEQRDVEIRIQPEMHVNADEHLMRVALENLFGNAWKFTSKHPIARIEFAEMKKEGKRVLYIRDDGAGFEMQFVEKLFGAFQRLHAQSEFSGTGIGLASVQRIIHRHGGSIWAEGKTEHGATFYFTLP